MNENWCVLCIAIDLEVTVEQAFTLYEEGKKRRCVTADDELYMVH